MAHNHGNEYQLKIVQEDGSEGALLAAVSRGNSGRRCWKPAASRRIQEVKKVPSCSGNAGRDRYLFRTKPARSGRVSVPSGIVREIRELLP